mgnify:FL=1
MNYLFEWLKGLLRLENISAIIGSLKRRALRRDFLEMKVNLNNKKISSITIDGMKITEYSEKIEKECISLLNSVGSLGFWSSSVFRKKILPSVDDPEKDIFILFDKSSKVAVGLSILHKRNLNNNSAEIGYVAVRPESRGEGIGYKLLINILAEMKRRDISYAYLKTDSFRIPAVKTYLKAGFYPYIRNEEENRRWQGIMGKLKASQTK